MRTAASFVGLLAVTALILSAMGQPLWCAAGDFGPWSGDIESSHNSQHLADPYTLTHLLHGVILYALFWALFGAADKPWHRLLAVSSVEVAWEIFENTPIVIERYRAGTMSLNYYGDSVLNSLGDIVACGLGFGAAAVLPAAASVAGFFAVEAILLLWIRDSLVLNVIMLAWPLEAIKNWQAGP